MLFRFRAVERSKTLPIVAVLLCSACPSSSSGPTDASPRSDAAANDALAASDGPATPYRHTIVIDGTNDFTTDESFATTTAGYAAYVSWDADYVYIGYAGVDIDTQTVDSATKWVFVYFDVDPGTGSGAIRGEQYNTQRPGFPSGFGAHSYYRWKSDDSFEGLQKFQSGDTWETDPTVVNAAVNGQFMEVAIALTTLLSPSKLGIMMLMVNEKALGEYSYAGLYDGSFADGYYDVSTSDIPSSFYLEADFSAVRVPNDLVNRKP